MNNYKKYFNGYSTPESRWSRFGPYYAMFPLEFAAKVITNHSEKGDWILDPFLGRGTSVYAGSILERKGLGIEINPVGWVFSVVKLNPAPIKDVLRRLKEICSQKEEYNKKILELPEFYDYCFCDEVLKFLLSAKDNLNWKEDLVDATLMGFILVYLHGKIGSNLSNQMQKTKAMGYDYSINWWIENNYSEPPKINPYEFMKKKVNWRYKKGRPQTEESEIELGDSTVILPEIVDDNNRKFSLLLTSPPYYGVTDYFIDQWLRLWMLGGSAKPNYSSDKHKGRFSSKENYYNLLDTVFSNASKVMKEKSAIYVRTDTREFTFKTTVNILKKNFPDHQMKIEGKPYNSRTQTEIFGQKSNKPGEMDIVLKK
ncbi:DNA methyltransferase [Acetohalobium arabaticum]|uniref:Methyltransferase n=1 Tax=Acetohalobium arabaticum (strain ATCC 49924 / DSM 5501 / Z-7288) TaxID=574087 RepID=D9QPJ9_ACEAZ|nr:DNA methyltransferase [Acetohalobium arabaticum]ADL12440.1 DNA methylase N-4/N-6 domain protein [Acetohalobium arabaticum DSM 5501]